MWLRCICVVPSMAVTLRPSAATYLVNPHTSIASPQPIQGGGLFAIRRGLSTNAVLHDKALYQVFRAGANALETAIAQCQPSCSQCAANASSPRTWQLPSMLFLLACGLRRACVVQVIIDRHSSRCQQGCHLLQGSHAGELCGKERDKHAVGSRWGLHELGPHRVL